MFCSSFIDRRILTLRAYDFHFACGGIQYAARERLLALTFEVGHFRNVADIS